MTNQPRNVTLQHKHFITLAALAAIATYGSPVFAGGSPWLPPPNGGSITVSYVAQNATKFYRSTVKSPTPGGGNDLSQKTVWVDGTYGLSDAVALDFRLGGARSSFATGPGLPPSKESITGLADINVGLVWRAVDEVVSSGPSLAFRAALIRAGSYETGYINSLGDGGNGFEVSALIGKFIADRFAVSGEFGYRNRTSGDHDIPANLFARLLAGVIVGNGVGLSLNYEMEDATSGLEIGGPGFSPSRFPELQEDIHLVGPTVSFAVSDQTNIGVSYAKVVHGRNTAASNVFSVFFRLLVQLIQADPQVPSSLVANSVSPSVPGRTGISDEASYAAFLTFSSQSADSAMRSSGLPQPGWTVMAAHSELSPARPAPSNPVNEVPEGTCAPFSRLRRHLRAGSSSNRIRNPQLPGSSSDAGPAPCRRSVPGA